MTLYDAQRLIHGPATRSSAPWPRQRSHPPGGEVGHQIGKGHHHQQYFQRGRETLGAPEVSIIHYGNLILADVHVQTIVGIANAVI
jgi:hypothetical protein